MSESLLRSAVIIPAFNEAGRITNVLKTVAAATLVDEVIVVADGCEDSTADEARGFAALLSSPAGAARSGETVPPLVRVLELPQNRGKGGAMTYGAHRTECPVILFLDADLIGLEPAHVDALLRPMLRTEDGGPAAMTLGLFGRARGGIIGWWLGVCHRRVAAISGQRAIRRDVFLAVPGLNDSRFGVETALTRYVRHVWRLRVEEVPLHGITHPLKEEKLGVLRGLRHRSTMYGNILCYLIADAVRHHASARHREEALRMRRRFNDLMT